MSDEPRVRLTGKLLTSREVAELLVVPVSTIQRWSRDGQLPTIRIGPPGRQTLRWTHELLEEFLTSRVDRRAE